jgi:APA family basic amino acid/polyamine antiporter
LALSTVIIIAIYLLINLAFLYVLSPEGMVGSDRVAADAAAAILGASGAAWIALLVVVSTFGANNGFILGASRIYYAMARAGLFFKFFGRLHPRRHSPVGSLALQALWACILVAGGTFEQLFTYVVFASWFFYAMSALAVIRLRFTAPEMERPYKVWGYPVTPLLFLLFSGWLVVSSIVENPRDSLVGVAIILSGLIFYYFRPRAMRE